MAVTTRVDSISRDIELIIAADLSPEAVSKAIAGFAREAIDDAAETNAKVLGSPPPKRVYVDGREGAPLESVKPVGGTILAEFDLLEDTLQWIGQQLVLHSPALSGEYARSHVMVIDDVAADFNAPIPPDFDEIVFVNVTPYARKIERGLSDQAPDGVYEAVAALAARRFGNIVKVRFSFRSPNFGGINSWASKTGASGRTSGGAKRDAWLRRQPAIVLTRG
jgi:hypothetical protein